MNVPLNLASVVYTRTHTNTTHKNGKFKILKKTEKYEEHYVYLVHSIAQPISYTSVDSAKKKKARERGDL